MTKYLLLPQFESVDMVDIIDSFIESIYFGFTLASQACFLKVSVTLNAMLKT